MSSERRASVVVPFQELWQVLQDGSSLNVETGAVASRRNSFSVQQMLQEERLGTRRCSTKSDLGFGFGGLSGNRRSPSPAPQSTSRRSSTLLIGPHEDADTIEQDAPSDLPTLPALPTLLTSLSHINSLRIPGGGSRRRMSSPRAGTECHHVASLQIPECSDRRGRGSYSSHRSSATSTCAGSEIIGRGLPNSQIHVIKDPILIQNAIREAGDDATRYHERCIRRNVAKSSMERAAGLQLSNRGSLLDKTPRGSMLVCAATQEDREKNSLKRSRRNEIMARLEAKNAGASPSSKLLMAQMGTKGPHRPTFGFTTCRSRRTSFVESRSRRVSVQPWEVA